MPITFDLEAVRQEYDCTVYCETGMYDPSDESVSLNQALRCNFSKLYSIELREDWVNKGLEKFRSDIEAERLRVVFDDSNNLQAHLKGNPTFEKNRCLFYLDAHVDGAFSTSGRNFVNRCPVFNELMAIKKLSRNDHIICIDDYRILKERFPWMEQSYGSDFNFVSEIKKVILSINPAYKFKRLNGVIPYDVLCAYLHDDPRDNDVQWMVKQGREQLRTVEESEEKYETALKWARKIKSFDGHQQALEFFAEAFKVRPTKELYDEMKIDM